MESLGYSRYYYYYQLKRKVDRTFPFKINYYTEPQIWKDYLFTNGGEDRRLRLQFTDRQESSASYQNDLGPSFRRHVGDRFRFSVGIIVVISSPCGYFLFIYLLFPQLLFQTFFYTLGWVGVDIIVQACLHPTLGWHLLICSGPSSGLLSN